MDEAVKLENYTYEDYLAIDKSTKERVELIFGKIYMMAGASAQHQDVVLNIATMLKERSREKGECHPRVAPFDLKLIVANQINVVQPDIMLFCEDENLPCAIFEVLSPSTALKDKNDKKTLYEKSGIKEYFLVDIKFVIVEKFELINNKYEYIKAYGINDKIELKCLRENLLVKDIFEGIEITPYDKE